MQSARKTVVTQRMKAWQMAVEPAMRRQSLLQCVNSGTALASGNERQNGAGGHEQLARMCLHLTPSPL